jgi:hypothetical protein
MHNTPCILDQALDAKNGRCHLKCSLAVVGIGNSLRNFSCNSLECHLDAAGLMTLKCGKVHAMPQMVAPVHSFPPRAPHQVLQQATPLSGLAALALMAHPRVRTHHVAVCSWQHVLQGCLCAGLWCAPYSSICWHSTTF